MAQAATIETTRPQPPILQDYLSERELASQFGVSRKAVARWRKVGEGPPVTLVGKSIYYKRAAVVAWLAAREGQAKRPRAWLREGQAKQRSRGTRRKVKP